MIHQLIFAAPRPGMTESEFQRYWINVHAARYASKIPQIKKYLIDTRDPSDPTTAATPWAGVAEIWLENEEEQLASLQTKEFLEGARLDEPRWAAFWQTVALDTDATVVREGPPLTREPRWVKLMLLGKRREGLPLAEFRERSRGEHADLVQRVPGLRRYLQGYTRDSAYTFGEAMLDVVHQLWFDDIDALTDAWQSVEMKRVRDDLESIMDQRYIHRLVASEHWVLGPESR